MVKELCFIKVEGKKKENRMMMNSSVLSLKKYQNYINFIYRYYNCKFLIMNAEKFDSSLKHFNFKGWTADQILEKYESVLASREKQITDLSIEMGSINDKLNILTEQVENYKKENEQLKAAVKKKESLLAQDLNNKEIMFIRLEKRENEYDKLKMKYDIMVRDKGELTMPSINNPIPPSSSSNYSSIQPKEVAQNNTIEQNKDKETKATEEDWKEKAKISARVSLTIINLE